MHKSLTVGANRTLILIYAAGVALLVIASGKVVFLSCLIGAGFGVAAGFLQRSVLQTHASALAQTTTAYVFFGSKIRNSPHDVGLGTVALSCFAAGALLGVPGILGWALRYRQSFAKRHAAVTGPSK